MMEPAPAQAVTLARLARRARRMPTGKARTQLLQDITKARVRNFEAGWQSFARWVDH